MKIRKYRSNDLIKVSKLISETYLEFNNAEGNKKAVQRYASWYSTNQKNLQNLSDNYKRTPIFFVAVMDKKIVGMIRGNKHQIVNLFVRGSQHKKGIGRSLLERFEKQARKSGSKEIRMKASIYAIPFYQKYGYIRTTGLGNFKGLRVQPMRKRI